MSPSAYSLIGSTAFVAMLVGILAFALLRFIAAARNVRRQVGGGEERALMSGAVEEAIIRLRAQERAMSARADALDRLNTDIVASLTAGLLVVGLDGDVRILNPAGSRLLGLPADSPQGNFRDLLGRHAPIVDALDECLATERAIVRRSVKVPALEGGTIDVMSVKRQMAP